MLTFASFRKPSLVHPNCFNHASFVRWEKRGPFCADEGALILLSHKVQANVMHQELLPIVSGCMVDPVSVLWGCVQVKKTILSDTEVLGWY